MHSSIYSSHSYFSDPGVYETILKELPTAIPDLVNICQGWVNHYLDLIRNNKFQYLKNTYQLQLRKVEEILSVIDPQLNGFSNGKVIGVCRHIALLLCSILRSKGHPCRLRFGFTDYQHPEFNHDDVILELFCANAGAWLRIDVRTTIELIDSLQLTIDFNLFDVPEPRFLPAHKVWKLYRNGQVDPMSYGTSTLRGDWYIRNSMILDFYSLLKIELLLWDATDIMQVDIADNNDLTSHLSLLDDLAKTISNFEKNNIIDDMLMFYSNNNELHIKQIISYGPCFPDGNSEFLNNDVFARSLVLDRSSHKCI